MLRKFAINRDRVMSQLFDGPLRRSAARDELLRLILLRFADGHLMRTSYYVKTCANYATPPSIRAELDIISQAGLTVYRRDDHRSPFVVPSEKLIDFYNFQMPRLRDEVLALLSDAAAQA